MSQELCKILKIVLDRSQINRIISHSSTCKSCWIALNTAGWQVRWSAWLKLFGLIYPLARRSKWIVALSAISCFAQPPCLPEPARNAFASSTLRNRRGTSLLAGFISHLRPSAANSFAGSVAVVVCSLTRIPRPLIRAKSCSYWSTTFSQS
jgi:hypothetical protein